MCEIGMKNSVLAFSISEPHTFISTLIIIIITILSLSSRVKLSVEPGV